MEEIDNRVEMRLRCDMQSLLIAVRNLEAENKQRKEALKKYGRHLIGCGSPMYNSSRPESRHKCSCGLEQAMKGK